MGWNKGSTKNSKKVNDGFFEMLGVVSGGGGWLLQSPMKLYIDSMQYVVCFC